ncbi:hypothetical protein [Nostoc sp. FACHB-190]|uniref:hypothetical protein n=1 Tax=Nostoc sp. FACHB-190 TaxID=2692838 RepID=UPI0016826A9E|nr:hypothetical protein [Nostoc sp. FACHB-190]MBD2298624.1 hypothetical protein [Nostoc sp. FACHB-190]
MIQALLNIFWQNTIFHWATVSLLIIAAILEVISIFKYKHSIARQIDLNKKIISYLEGQKQRIAEHESQNQGLYELNQIPNRGLSWFKKYMVGTSTEDGFQARIEGGRFVLVQYPAILTRSIPSSSLRFVPTILIAIGVLGTFYGIQEGLSKINISNIDQDTSNLLNASVQLLEGMKTAFSTSLMGLGSSSVFTIILAVMEVVKRQPSQKLRSRLDEIAFLESPGRLLSRLNSDATERAAENLSNAANSMRTSFTELIEVQRQLRPDAIGREVGAVMSPIFEDIRQELSVLREIKNDQGQEILKNLIEQQREELIKPIIAELRQSAQLTQEASQAVRELREQLGGISQSLSQSIITIQQFQQETLVQLREFAVNLQSIFNEFRTDTQGVMERVSTEIQSAVAASIHAIDSQRTAFESSANQAANTFRGIREDLQAALHTQAETERQMLQEFQDRTLAIITTQTETITTVGNEASRLMDGARENLTATLSNIDMMLQNTRITVQEQLEQFRLSYQEALQEFFVSQNQLLEETLGEQRQGLAQVVNDLQSAFQEEYQRRSSLATEMEQNLTRIEETTRIVSNFAEKIGLMSGERLIQIQEITRVLGQEATRIEKTYAGMIQQLNQALESSNQHLVSYLQKASESEMQFFTQADVATAKISNQLLQAANYLVAAEANRRHQSNGQ